MRYAQLAAGTALIGGQKSVEVVHAYILLALYPVPARKWEDDRSWIYLGVAIRFVAVPYTTCGLLITGYPSQHRHGSQSAPPHYRQGAERAARARDAKPHACLAELLQPRPIDRVAVRQAAHHQQRGLHCEPVGRLVE